MVRIWSEIGPCDDKGFILAKKKQFGLSRAGKENTDSQTESSIEDSKDDTASKTGSHSKASNVICLGDAVTDSKIGSSTEDSKADEYSGNLPTGSGSAYTRSGSAYKIEFDLEKYMKDAKADQDSTNRLELAMLIVAVLALGLQLLSSTQALTDIESKGRREEDSSKLQTKMVGSLAEMEKQGKVPLAQRFVKGC